jgi:hypothetical protein
MDSNQLINFLKRIRVLATHLLTWLLILQTALTTIVASGQLDQFPELLKWAVVVLTGIGSAIAVIRRVTPVPKDGRGLLPK